MFGASRNGRSVRADAYDLGATPPQWRAYVHNTRAVLQLSGWVEAELICASSLNLRHPIWSSKDLFFNSRQQPITTLLPWYFLGSSLSARRPFLSDPHIRAPPKQRGVPQRIFLFLPFPSSWALPRATTRDFSGVRFVAREKPADFAREQKLQSDF